MQVLLQDAPTIATSRMRAATLLLRCYCSVLRCVAASTTVTSVRLRQLSSSSPLLLLLSWCLSLSLFLLLLLLLSLTSCCSGASPVLVQTVLVSGCMLFVLAVLSLLLWSALFSVPLRYSRCSGLCETILKCFWSAISRCNFMQMPHMLANASDHQQPNASDNHTAPFGASRTAQSVRLRQ